MADPMTEAQNLYLLARKGLYAAGQRRRKAVLLGRGMDLSALNAEVAAARVVMVAARTTLRQLREA